MRDYLRVLRRFRIMLVVLAVIGAAAGFVYASRQHPTYKATAQVAFQDPTQDLGIVGLASNSVQAPGQAAAVAAALVSAPRVIDQARRELRTPVPAQELSSAVSAQVSIPSGLLEINATASDPAFAARLANAVAGVLAAQANAQARGQFAQLAAHVQGQIARLHPTGSGASNSELNFYEDELGRLNTLAAFAKSAQLVEPAQAPVPTSTSRARSTLLGLLFGLLLAIVVAFLRDSTDRRLRSAQEVKQSFRLPVLARVRDRAMGSIAQLPNGSRRGRELDLEAFRILRRNLEFLDPDGPPRKILVTSAVQEEGKTTVAGSLALAMAAAGRRTLLVECDFRRPALASRLGVEARPGVSDYLTGTAEPHEILRTVSFFAPRDHNDHAGGNGHAAAGNGHAAGHPVQLVFIPAGSPTSQPSELLGSRRFREFIDEVAGTYDVVVLDSSPLLPVSDTLEILPSADAVVICARASETTPERASATREVLARVPERPTGLVVTGIRAGAEGYDAPAYAYAGG